MKFTAVTENHLYSKAYTRGRKYVGRRVVVYVLRDTHAGRLKKANPLKCMVNRIGLTATKKLGGAVTRNRCKRIMREAYRLLDAARSVRRGNIIIIVARDAAVHASSAEIRSDLDRAMLKLSMYADMPAPAPEKPK